MRLAEIRGCALVTEYLTKEKVPYLFGCAGHGAVGLLDGVYNHHGRRIERAARTVTEGGVLDAFAGYCAALDDPGARGGDTGAPAAPLEGPRAEHR